MLQKSNIKAQFDSATCKAVLHEGRANDFELLWSAEQEEVVSSQNGCNQESGI